MATDNARPGASRPPLPYGDNASPGAWYLGRSSPRHLRPVAQVTTPVQGRGIWNVGQSGGMVPGMSLAPQCGARIATTPVQGRGIWNREWRNCDCSRQGVNAHPGASYSGHQPGVVPRTTSRRSTSTSRSRRLLMPARGRCAWDAASSTAGLGALYLGRRRHCARWTAVTSNDAGPGASYLGRDRASAPASGHGDKAPARGRCIRDRRQIVTMNRTNGFLRSCRPRGWHRR